MNAFSGLFKKLKVDVESFVNEMIVTIYSQRQISITFYGKVVQFDDFVLIVDDGKKILKVLGSGLVLSEMADNYLVVDGKIDSVEFCKTKEF